MSNSPKSPPLADTGDDGFGKNPSVEELAASSAAAERPRSAPTPNLPGFGGLPLTTSSPNPLHHIPLSAPLSVAPAGGLPASITGVVDFKLALDGANFTRWRNYLDLILAR